jgi:23S rRNA (pseudouridine1915-N3)-methyltransferase
MYKIKIFSVGKTKEAWLETAFEEYVKRLKPWTVIECSWFKNDEQLIQAVEKEDSVIALDPQGQQYDSVAFAHHVDVLLEKGGSRLTFVIGGADGLPVVLKKNPIISFSKMTFTHQLTRLVLIEQLYRTYTILNDTPYHK